MPFGSMQTLCPNEDNIGLSIWKIPENQKAGYYSPGQHNVKANPHVSDGNSWSSVKCWTWQPNHISEKQFLMQPTNSLCNLPRCISVGDISASFHILAEKEKDEAEAGIQLVCISFTSFLIVLNIIALVHNICWDCESLILMRVSSCIQVALFCLLLKRATIQLEERS